MMTMGSLFDGIGGFPLAAIQNGITPVWASEIEPFPIRVTKIRFPNMSHVGDITKLKGANLPLVDVICGGSPCQDLSIAGQRKGLAGERSGLFMEQVRIVKEMRNVDANKGLPDDLVRPRYLVWENVPGAFSSTQGEDFLAVIEEIIHIKDSTCHVPRPDTGRWKSAGAAILGDRFSLAWRVLDAQYWGVAQRRRRIFLVADFGGLTAPKILFEQDRLFGNSTQSKSTGQGTSRTAKKSTDPTSRTCLTLEENRQTGLLCLNDQGGNRMDISEEMTGTLCAGMSGHPPLIAEQTRATGTRGNNELVLFENHGKDCRYHGPLQVAPTVAATYGTGGNNVPLLSQPMSFLQESYCIAGNIIDRKVQNGGNGLGCQPDISYTLTGMDRHAVFRRQRSDQLVENEVASTQSARQHKDATDLVYQPNIFGQFPDGAYDKECSTLCASGGEYRLIRRLTPLECERLQGFPDGWTAIPRGSDSARYKALGNSVAIPCVDFVMRGIAYFLRKNREEL